MSIALESSAPGSLPDGQPYEEHSFETKLSDNVHDLMDSMGAESIGRPVEDIEREIHEKAHKMFEEGHTDATSARTVAENIVLGKKKTRRDEAA